MCWRSSRYGHRREILRALTAPDEHVAAASERLERRGRR
jgi:hypothetical protein